MLLPIDKYLAEIEQTLHQQNNLVLQAEPGAGKSTKVPLGLLNAAFLAGRKIIMLEPRRVAVKSIAHYLAKQLGEEVGQRVGYQIRNEQKTSINTVLEIITEGILTKRIQHDPELKNVALIIFDEFHERSLHADLGLMLALEVQQAYRDDLKLLVMSATINTEFIANYLADAAIIKCAGRTFPVTVEYMARSKVAGANNHLVSDVFKAIDVILAGDESNESGDILVFLPGQADIKRCLVYAQEYHQTQHQGYRYLPLYGSLPLVQQELVLKKNTSEQRRIIFATNIAETSLTIVGITAVIDSGLEKTLAFDVKSGLSRLQTSYISKASAHQRTGRAGRIQAGKCIRLWSPAKQQELTEFQPEEITITDLSALVLELAAWGIHQFDDVNWLTPPPKQHFDVACQLDQELGLLDGTNKLTAHGQAALKVGVEPRLAGMLVKSKSTTEQQVSCLLAALLTERDILVNASSSNMVDRVLILNDFISKNSSLTKKTDNNTVSDNHHNHFTQHLSTNKNTLQQVAKLARSFAKLLNISFSRELSSLNNLSQVVALLLLQAYPDRLAKLRSNSINNKTNINNNKNTNNTHDNRYVLANGRGVRLTEFDAMQGEAWLVVCDCDGQNKDGVIYTCASITLNEIKSGIADHLRKNVHYALDAKKEKIIARQQYLYQNLVLEEQVISNTSQDDFIKCVADIVRAEGLCFLNWTEKCQTWLARAKWLGQMTDDFPLVTEELLLAKLEQWLIPYLTPIKSIKQLKQLNIYDLLIANISWQQNQLLAQQAPVDYVAPSGKSVLIRYNEAQGPTVAIVLQEMFGQLTSPTLANGKVLLRFELLSPARRPIQTTSDLANFWRTSYFDVAKDMKGQYPKHRWPEKPLEEKPGRSIKRQLN